MNLQTISPARARAAVWDVVVVGAGPTGAMAAREAARVGAAVLVLDKADFPRDKVCGCCISAAAIGHLDLAGLGDRVRRLGGAEIGRFTMNNQGQCWGTRIPAGRALSRYRLDLELLVAATEAGASVMTGAIVESTSPGSPGRDLAVRVGSERITIAAGVVVAADGLRSSVAAGEPALRDRARPNSYIGLGARVGAHDSVEPGGIVMLRGPSGYVGLVRVEDGSINVAAAMDPAAIRAAGDPGSLIAGVLARARVGPIPAIESVRWKATPRLTRSLADVAADRLLVAGDAAGYVEPFTGEGMAWAIASGRAVGPLAAAGARDWSPEIARRWRRWYDSHMRSRHERCRWIARTLRSSSATRLAMGLMSSAPALARPIVASVAGRGAAA